MSLVIILIGSLALAASAPSEPKCHMNHLWHCEEVAMEGLDALPKRSIPHTQEELEALCKKTNEAISCVTDFRDKCMTPVQKELVTLLSEGVLSGQQELCDPSSETHKNYMDHASCLNEVSQMDEVKEELEYILAVMEKAESVELSKRITYTCCAYAKTTESFQRLGSEHCGQDATEAMQGIIAQGVSQLPEILCNGYSADEDRCRAVLPPLGSKTQGSAESPVLEAVKQKFSHWLDE